MGQPTKAEQDNLVKAYAIYKASGMRGSGASLGQQQRLYAKYIAALDKVLTKLGDRSLSPENQAGLDRRADQWLAQQAMQGAGKWW